MPDPWRDAMLIPVVRGNGITPPVDLESGVKFFVLMLERLGCQTHFSCEGHPAGFYITFTARYETARRIANLGYFNVSLARSLFFENTADLFDLSLSEKTPEGEPWDEVQKGRALQFAAEAWENAFGGAVDS